MKSGKSVGCLAGQQIRRVINLVVFMTLLMAGTGNAWNSMDTIPVSPIKTVIAGPYHTLAIRWNLSVSAWGDNTYGQVSGPNGLAGVIAVAAGMYHSVALRIDGTVVAWGDNSLGQLNIPTGLTGVRAIAAGNTHTVALKSDGTVVAWGDNSSGQCSVPANIYASSIDAGASHSIAKSGGTVFIWGGTSSPPPPSSLTTIGGITLPSLGSMVN